RLTVFVLVIVFQHVHAFGGVSGPEIIIVGRAFVGVVIVAIAFQDGQPGEINLNREDMAVAPGVAFGVLTILDQADTFVDRQVFVSVVAVKEGSHFAIP